MFREAGHSGRVVLEVRGVGDQRRGNTLCHVRRSHGAELGIIVSPQSFHPGDGAEIQVTEGVDRRHPIPSASGGHRKRPGRHAGYHYSGSLRLNH